MKSLSVVVRSSTSAAWRRTRSNHRHAPPIWQHCLAAQKQPPSAHPFRAIGVVATIIGYYWSFEAHDILLGEVRVEMDYTNE